MCAHGSAARMLVSRVRAGTIVQPQTHVNKRAAESRCQLRHPREDDSFLSKFKPATRVSLRLDIRARLESGDRSVLVSSAVASVSAPVAMVECLICDWSYFQVADDSSTSLYPVRVLQPANQQPCTGGPGEHVPGPTCISSPVAQMSSALAQARALEEDWGLALGWLLGSTVGPIPDSVCRIVLRIALLTRCRAQRPVCTHPSWATGQVATCQVGTVVRDTRTPTAALFRRHGMMRWGWDVI